MLFNHESPLRGNRFVTEKTIREAVATSRGVHKTLLLGLAYKADGDDDRESPSYILIEKLEAKGARVEYHDPYLPAIRKTREHSHLAGRKSVPIDSSCDMVLISTAHGPFKTHDFSGLKVPLVGTRNCVVSSKRPRLYFQA